MTSLLEESKVNTYSVFRGEANRVETVDWTFPQLHNEQLPIGAKKRLDGFATFDISRQSIILLELEI